MPEMKTNERMKLIIEHKEADRCPIVDYPWQSALVRWRKEGMPEKVSFEDYFEIDKIMRFHVDNSPGYPESVIEETEEYIINTTGFGVTQKNWKNAGGVPEYLDFTIINPDIWNTIPPKQWTQRRDGANIGTVSGTEVSNGRREAETQF